MTGPIREPMAQTPDERVIETRLHQLHASRRAPDLTERIAAAAAAGQQPEFARPPGYDSARDAGLHGAGVHDAAALRTPLQPLQMAPAPVPPVQPVPRAQSVWLVGAIAVAAACIALFVVLTVDGHGPDAVNNRFTDAPSIPGQANRGNRIVANGDAPAPSSNRPGLGRGWPTDDDLQRRIDEYVRASHGFLRGGHLADVTARDGRPDQVINRFFDRQPDLDEVVRYAKVGEREAVVDGAPERQLFYVMRPHDTGTDATQTAAEQKLLRSVFVPGTVTLALLYREIDALDTRLAITPPGDQRRSMESQLQAMKRGIDTIGDPAGTWTLTRIDLVPPRDPDYPRYINH